MLRPLLGIGTILYFLACSNHHEQITTEEFKSLMNNVAVGWSTQNSPMALSSFAKDAVYMEPPNIQYYRGHDQLKPYFEALTEEYRMEFHQLWFDEKTQTGTGEYTFSYGKETADVGVVVVAILNGKIVFWREYQQKGPTDFTKFIATENKHWKWTIENYP